ncbi:MAG: hypothetical protein A4E65_01934 [Syntrophorhabdus sp. PtaU1.Bin153]|nr:MAG: hypothetical protein A4E65_01934 [Syntrophorhabdus sp. PtaU1.Bin153]
MLPFNGSHQVKEFLLLFVSDGITESCVEGGPLGFKINRSPNCLQVINITAGGTLINLLYECGKDIFYGRTVHD